MSERREALPEDGGFYEGRAFRGVDLAGGTLADATFEGCTFAGCLFAEATLYRCSFSDCVFEDCDLSRAKLPNSRFVETRFRRCKAIGIDWTVAGASTLTRLPLSVSFEESAISYASFYGLALPRAAIVRCQAFECDFKGSTFARTNLGHADLREARNYAIDPTANTIRKARFSLPDALVLLSAFDIEVE
jgi:fluoroquinolone resistance protein